jgi:hypothetical protein
VFAAPEDQAMRNAVLDWAADVGAGRDALIIAQTEAQVTELNRQAAEHLARKRGPPGSTPAPSVSGSPTETPRSPATGSRPAVPAMGPHHRARLPQG